MSAKILVIDDEHSIRDLLREFLTSQGYQVLLAEDGEKGVQLGADREIKLALVDLRLPGIGGLEVIQKLRQKNPSLGCIIMTAYPTLESKAQGEKEGAYGFITKPFKLPELLALIEKGLKQSRK